MNTKIKMVNNNIWVIVGVALVVAVVASIVTANITGNTIRLNQDKNGVYNVYTKMEIDAKLSGAFYGCYKKGGSTLEWGDDVYNNTSILSNSVTVECSPNEEIFPRDFVCNPRYWQQLTPGYVDGVSSISRQVNNQTINGAKLQCTGGQSQGILNVWCCKKN